MLKTLGGGGVLSLSFQGADLRYTIELDSEEAVKGTNVEIEVPTTVPCDECGGSGAKKGTCPAKCKSCRGAGQVRTGGPFSLQYTCPTCSGEGKTTPESCTECHGQGSTEARKYLTVKVPAGVDSGDRIRFAGEGCAGTPAGDLYVQIAIKGNKSTC